MLVQPLFEMRLIVIALKRDQGNPFDPKAHAHPQRQKQLGSLLRSLRWLPRVTDSASLANSLLEEAIQLFFPVLSTWGLFMDLFINSTNVYVTPLTCQARC